MAEIGGVITHLKTPKRQFRKPWIAEGGPTAPHHAQKQSAPAANRSRGALFQKSYAAYRRTRSRLAISPTMPRRKASTQAMKMTPWITVTQAPISAR